MLEKTILLALITNWLVLNPVYLIVVNKLPPKPFKCCYCMAFWIGSIISLITLDWNYLIIAMAGSYLASMIERGFKALPVTL